MAGERAGARRAPAASVPQARDPPPAARVPVQAQCIQSVKMLQPQFHHFLRELTCATRCQAWKSEHKDGEVAGGADLASAQLQPLELNYLQSVASIKYYRGIAPGKPGI